MIFELYSVVKVQIFLSGCQRQPRIRYFWRPYHNYAKKLKQAIPISEYPDRSIAKKVMLMGEPRKEQLDIKGMEPKALVRIERMDEAHTASYIWEQMGCPSNLSKEQEQILKEVNPEKMFLRADESGCLHLDLTLKPWEVVLIQQVEEGT